MKYIIENKDYIKVPDNYEQKFAHEPFAATSKSTIMSFKESGAIDNKDIKIVDFIYSFTFVTYEQIERFCNMNNIEGVEGRLQILFTSVIINKFCLMDVERYPGLIPNDAKMFYCIANGGKQLLDAYSDRGYIAWEHGSNFCSSRKVSKAVLDAEIWFEMNNLGNKLINYAKRPIYNLKAVPFSVEGSYSFEYENGVDYIITDIIRKNERIDEIREKFRQYESMFCTKIWKKYYPDASRQPMLLIVVDNEDVALNVAREITTTTKLQLFLLSTDERIRRGFDNEGSVLKYDADEDCLYEMKYKL